MTSFKLDDIIKCAPITAPTGQIFKMRVTISNDPTPLPILSQEEFNNFAVDAITYGDILQKLGMPAPCDF